MEDEEHCVVKILKSCNVKTVIDMVVESGGGGGNSDSHGREAMA